MQDWQAIVANFLRFADPEGEFLHIANPPATPDAINAAEQALDVTLPDELRSFYLCHDGIGLAAPDEPPRARFIRPVGALVPFVHAVRSQLAKTHPDVARTFLPFVDWENGDVTGYLLQSDATVAPDLVTFSHEHYRHRSDQNSEEFLVEGFASLAELLMPESTA